jgi:hypothetical protein
MLYRFVEDTLDLPLPERGDVLGADEPQDIAHPL